MSRFITSLMYLDKYLFRYIVNVMFMFIASLMYLDKYLFRYIVNAMNLVHSYKCLYSEAKGVSFMPKFSRSNLRCSNSYVYINTSTSGLVSHLSYIFP